MNGLPGSCRHLYANYRHLPRLCLCIFSAYAYHNFRSGVQLRGSTLLPPASQSRRPGPRAMRCMCHASPWAGTRPLQETLSHP